MLPEIKMRNDDGNQRVAVGCAKLRWRIRCVPRPRIRWYDRGTQVVSVIKTALQSLLQAKRRSIELVAVDAVAPGRAVAEGGIRPIKDNAGAQQRSFVGGEAERLEIAGYDKRAGSDQGFARRANSWHAETKPCEQVRRDESDDDFTIGVIETMRRNDHITVILRIFSAVSADPTYEQVRPFECVKFETEHDR